MEKQKIINSIEKSYSILAVQADLSPKNSIINTTLDNLVEDVIKHNKYSHLFCEDVFTCPKIAKISPKIREYCQRAEVEMEHFWSDYFINKNDFNVNDLQEFIHYKCYKNIANQEMDLLKRNKIKYDNVAFIGSGPLPMSSLLMASNFNHITNIDHCPKAIEKSDKLTKKLFSNIANIKSSAKDFAYFGCDVCFIASMIVGKEDLLEELYKQNIKYLIIRDALKLTQLFYEKLGAGIFQFYEKIDEANGFSKTLNSSYLLKRKEWLHTYIE